MPRTVNKRNDRVTRRGPNSCLETPSDASRPLFKENVRTYVRQDGVKTKWAVVQAFSHDDSEERY